MHPMKFPDGKFVSLRGRCAVGIALLAFLSPGTPALDSRPWSLRIDLLDVDGGGRWNQRHVQQEGKRTVACCLDVAWMPWNPASGSLRFGGGLNLGGWMQDLDVGPHVRVADLVAQASARWTGSGASRYPWARLDVGPALLVVERRDVGADWGVGGAFQAGFAFVGTSADLLFGAGADFRRYANLHVADIPALTISVGAGL